MLTETIQTRNTYKCILPSAVSRSFPSFAKTENNDSNTHSTPKKNQFNIPPPAPVRDSLHLLRQGLWPKRSLGADSESGDSVAGVKTVGDGKDRGEGEGKDKGYRLLEAESRGFTVGGEDGDVGCCSDSSDEGFAALVRGDYLMLLLFGMTVERLRILMMDWIEKRGRIVTGFWLG